MTFKWCLLHFPFKRKIYLSQENIFTLKALLEIWNYIKWNISHKPKISRQQIVNNLINRNLACFLVIMAEPFVLETILKLYVHICLSNKPLILTVIWLLDVYQFGWHYTRVHITKILWYFVSLSWKSVNT